MLYGTECLAVIKSQNDNQVSISEIRMLSWMSAKIRQDKIRNDTIRERVRAPSIVKKLVENKLKRFVHLERKPVDVVVRRVDQMKGRSSQKR